MATNSGAASAVGMTPTLIVLSSGTGSGGGCAAVQAVDTRARTAAAVKRIAKFIRGCSSRGSARERTG
ncbi:hypothetical protein GCM10009850_007730 [Nonomuraea monospora]|uniref:Uncharacterized protein n=1 Tax=Nonomuraea monospora TaxID=568818 RepID=A0ABP5P425_9ACTN